jgi:hypothetical protein
MDPTHAVAVIHLTAIALGCIAFIALNLSPLYANIVFGLVCLSGLVTLLIFDRKSS